MKRQIASAHADEVAVATLRTNPHILEEHLAFEATINTERMDATINAEHVDATAWLSG